MVGRILLPHSAPMATSKPKVRPSAISHLRIEGEPAFVLQITPWRETSLVVELFSLHHGRVSGIAKGAKRPLASLRALQLQFAPLIVSWSGQNELRTISRADWHGGLDCPEGEGLICAFYMNELLLKLLPREDAHPDLFVAYRETLARLSGAPGCPPTPDEQAWALRKFEWQILKSCGYAPDLSRDSQSETIQPNQFYDVTPETGLRRTNASNQANRLVLNGAQVQQLNDLLHREDTFPDMESLQSAKRLMRLLMLNPLEGKPLRTREFLVDLHRLSGVSHTALEGSGAEPKH